MPKAVFAFACCLIAIMPMIAQPTLPDAHFHHLHLNATDPAAAIDFYTTKFDAEKSNYHGEAAVLTQKSWILFNKVNQPPISDTTSAIWHFGWGAEDMKATYEKQLASGTRFQTPLTDISDIGGGTQMGRFFYAYVDGPDHSLIELNTAAFHRFGHIHMFSADPIAAGEWYARHLGARMGSKVAQKRMYRDVQIAPSASIYLDNVNIIIYPVEYTGRTTLESTRGHVVDHIAISVDNLNAAAARLKAAGITVTNGFMEGPDKIQIELIEGQAHD